LNYFVAFVVVIPCALVDLIVELLIDVYLERSI